MTSLAAELGAAPSLTDVAAAAEPYLSDLLSFTGYTPSAPLLSRPQTAVSYGLQL